MWRIHNQFTAKRGAFPTLVEVATKLNKLARERRWKESTYWVASTGRDNTFVVETIFQNLDSWREETRRMSDDDEWKREMRRATDNVVEGSESTEILELAEGPELLEKLKLDCESAADELKNARDELIKVREEHLKVREEHLKVREELQKALEELQKLRPKSIPT